MPPHLGDQPRMLFSHGGGRRGRLGHAALPAINLSAAARASSVISAPDSMRAISSRRARVARMSTSVTAVRAAVRLLTRRC